MRSFRIAWSFLTRLPGGTHPDDEDSLAQSTPWFPVVGAVVGAGLGLAYLGLHEVVAPTVAALLVVGLGAIVTGAFHEDGLADTADAAGGYDPARRLEIMRDSRIGTFGTLALVVATGLKVASLAQLDGGDGLGALVAAHTLGRVAAISVMRAGPEARTDGLAATSAALRGPAIPIVVVLVCAGAVALGPSTAAAVLAGVTVAMACLLGARRWLGGTTGDVLGAVEQLIEIATLVIIAELVVDAGWSWA